jgi:hypothetical protein
MISRSTSPSLEATKLNTPLGSQYLLEGYQRKRGTKGVLGSDQFANSKLVQYRYYFINALLTLSNLSDEH